MVVIKYFCSKWNSFGKRGEKTVEMQNDILSVLRETRVFRNMSRETEEMLLALEIKSVSAGDAVTASEISLGVLLSGKAAIYGRDSGKRVLLNRIEKGDIFDAATVFFSEKGMVSSVVAKTKCRVLFIERSVLEKIIESDARVAHDYIIFLSDKICFLNRKIIAFTAKNADASLASFLLNNVNETDVLSVNMSRLAATLDIGRTTLYRAVDALRAADAIAYDGRELRILDRKKLESFAKDPKERT